MRPLGRNLPPDHEHLIQYPLSKLEKLPTGLAVPIGVNWYTAFDSPKQLKDGSYHLADVAKGELLGTVRGGHCFGLVPMGGVKEDTTARWKFYNQAQEGACEGFGHARAQTINLGPLFDAFWLYDEARKMEGTYPNGEGSTNRAACKALQTVGLRKQTAVVCSRDEGHDGPVEKHEGLKTYRWALTAEEICQVLGRINASAVPFENSWGEDYPKEVWMPIATLERLMKEEGEASVFTEN
jgi:hypothetical protein